jgi:Trypsin-like peptidase domain
VDPEIQLAEMKRCILPLAATTREAKWIGLGTGFVVGLTDTSRAALVMTAAHVLKYATTLDPYLRRSVSLPGLVPPELPSLGGTTVFALLPTGSPAKMSRCWWRDDSDIGLAVVTLPEGEPALFDKKIPIDITPFIQPGTEVVAIGYPSFAGDFVEPPDYENQRIHVQVSWKIDSRIGKVVEPVMPHGNHPGIGVRVSCSFPHGMSGGPVLAGDETHVAVRALVSADWDEQNSEGGLAALLTPSLAIKAEYLTVQTASGELKDPTVWEMIQGGVIQAVGIPTGIGSPPSAG